MSKLVQLLSRLPRIGEKMAASIAAGIADQPEDYKLALAKAIEQHAAPAPCPICGDNLLDGRCRCLAAVDPSRILVVRFPADLAKVASTGVWTGSYHVLRGLLDPANGVGGEQLTVRALLGRLRGEVVREVVLGLGGSDLARDTTAWLAALLRPSVAVYEMGVGLAFGQSLEYADDEAIVAAINGRREVVSTRSGRG